MAVCGRGLLDQAEVASDSLNQLMALPLESRLALRSRISEILTNRKWQAAAEPLLIPASDAILCLPAQIPDYTDFYASIFHATNVGRLLRPDNPLLPNYKYVPIGYHGRASSIVVSGAAVRRPKVSENGPTMTAPEFGPSRSLDYELEVGVFIGRGNRWANQFPSAKRKSISSACAFSTTGRRAISRRGNTSRWGHSSPRVLRRQYRRGWYHGSSRAIPLRRI